MTQQRCGESASSNLGTHAYSEGKAYQIAFKRTRTRQSVPAPESYQNSTFTDFSHEGQDAITKDLNEFIALELSLVPEVEYVYTAIRDGVFYVWTVIDRFAQAAREGIYGRQIAVIDEFPMYEFDFYIIAREGRPVGDLISESVTLTFDRSRSTARAK